MKKLLVGLLLVGSSYSAFASTIYCEAFENGNKTLDVLVSLNNNNEIYPKQELRTDTGRKFNLSVTSVHADRKSADVLIEVSNKLANGEVLSQTAGGSDLKLATYIEKSPSNSFHINCFDIKL